MSAQPPRNLGPTQHISSKDSAMSMSSINGSTSAYDAYFNFAQKQSASSDSPDRATLNSFSTQQTVTAINTSTGAAETQTLRATPMAVAWAPQMFVQGDKNNDDALSLDEFQAQLSRVGVGADDAKQLFSSFDTSDDGLVSLTEFVTGVSRSISSGNQVFNDLMDSYTRDSDGNLDQSKTDSFLSAGQSKAETFWKNLG
ncbi:EF-hand domain-containing protein [Paraburkholderia bannensis]|uniref:EF-hand domain-containing protein n=2 Tax=Paraburkholderia bannensis TaxID=765414 RepID=UPI002ABD76B4|nr:EF-hand domain-containing protein [Paraburkholderia bannensis]